MNGVSEKADLAELREEVKRQVLEEAERLDVVLKTTRGKLVELVEISIDLKRLLRNLRLRGL